MGTKRDPNAKRHKLMPSCENCGEPSHDHKHGECPGKSTEYEPKKMKRSGRLRPVSRKQAKRNRELKSKLVVLMTLQHELYGTSGCQMQGVGRTHFGDFVVDHVNTRNVPNPDAWSNLGVLCFGCNSSKGSRRFDYRPEEFKKRLAELDGL